MNSIEINADDAENVSGGIQRLSLQQYNAKAMDIDQATGQIEPIGLERAQQSLATCKADLAKAAGTLGALWMCIEDSTTTAETKIELEE